MPRGDKLLAFSEAGLRRYGMLAGEQVEVISGGPFDRPTPTGEVRRLSELKLLAPVQPSKAVCVGLNYRDHAAEMKADLPGSPLLFLKPSTAVIGPDEEIVYPPSSQQVDYESELAVVIGKPCRAVSEADVPGYILGLTCANDVTARDLQRSDGQWTRAKSFDTFLPLGPYIATGLEGDDLAITGRLNGRVVQSSRTSRMIFGIPRLISFISQVMTLLPGDVILTGTPPGVGPMRPGDVIEVEIEGIGLLRNRLKA